MDPISLIFFAVILPVSALFSAYVIWRFRRNYRTQLKSYKAQEQATALDSETGSRGNDNTSAFVIDLDEDKA